MSGIPGGEPAESPPSRAPHRARTLFFGSGSFGVPVLDALLEAPEAEVVGVVSVPDRPSGRHGILTSSPVAARARGLGLPVLQPAGLRKPGVVEQLAILRPDLGVLADYGRIVPPSILELPAHGILNLHPSLLPRHRGASPVPATILAGDPEAGVTLMLMDERLDAGPIVAAEAWPLDGSETAPELEARAAVEAGRLLRRHLAGWLAGSLQPRPQDDSAATMTRPLTREDGRLDPACAAAQLERHVRALQPWPGSYVETRLGRLSVWRAAVVRPVEPPSVPLPASTEPGTIVADGDGLALTTADGLLRLLEVQLAGGRRMPAPDLRRGHAELLSSAR